MPDSDPKSKILIWYFQFKKKCKGPFSHFRLTGHMVLIGTQWVMWSVLHKLPSLFQNILLSTDFRLGQPVSLVQCCFVVVVVVSLVFLFFSGDPDVI